MPKLATPPVAAAPDPGPALAEGDPSADQFPDPGEGASGDGKDYKPTAKKATTRKPQATATRPDSPLRRAQPLANSGTYINGLWYGREGTGKTTHVLHMANLGRVLAINAEGGFEKRPLAKHGIDTEKIIVFPPEGEGTEALTFDNLESIFVDMKRDLEDDPRSWAGTVWDSGTDIADVLLGGAVAWRQEKAEKKGVDVDPWFVDRADYGVMAQQFKQLLTRFRDLPCHFAITALERRDTDDDGKVAYGPAVIPSLVTSLLGLPKIVVHTSVDEIAGAEEYIGDTRARGKYRAKDRFNILPPRMIDPVFTRVLGYVQEEIDADTDPIQTAVRERVAAERVRGAAGAGSGKTGKKGGQQQAEDD